MRAEAAAKREEIERKELEAENLRNMPVDDSKMVEGLFGFLPEGPTDDTDGMSILYGSHLLFSPLCITSKKGEVLATPCPPCPCSI